MYFSFYAEKLEEAFLKNNFDILDLNNFSIKPRRLFR